MGAVNLIGCGLARVLPFVKADFAVAVGVETRQHGGLVDFPFSKQGGQISFLSSTALVPPRVTCSPMT
ncbi:MAG: hypothetical protein Q8K35_03500, partial [Thiobacillus sp.]|nr:hypothetical protein [Thiobacillus sp.]